MRRPTAHTGVSEGFHTCGFSAGERPSFLTTLSAPQINGIALDNKSVTECEALLRSCRDTLSLSITKVVVILYLT